MLKSRIECTISLAAFDRKLTRETTPVLLECLHILVAFTMPSGEMEKKEDLNERIESFINETKQGYVRRRLSMNMCYFNLSFVLQSTK